MTASSRPLLGFPIRDFGLGESLASAGESMDEVYLLIQGRADVYALDGNGSGKLMTSSVRELREGDLVNPELLTSAGSRGASSGFTVKAKTPVSAYIVTLESLSDPSVSDEMRYQRVAVVMNAIASSTIDATNQRVRAIEATDSYEKDLTELTEQNATLRQENVRLHELNKQITLSAVQRTVVDQLGKLNKQVRELTDEKRNLTRDLAERTGEAKSALDYAKSVTDDIEKLEHLRDLLELEMSDEKKFFDELQRIFIILLGAKSKALQNLGVYGLGILSKVSPHDLTP